jgi:hypothetical protein
MNDKIVVDEVQVKRWSATETRVEFPWSLNPEPGLYQLTLERIDKLFNCPFCYEPVEACEESPGVWMIRHEYPDDHDQCVFRSARIVADTWSAATRLWNKLAWKEE